MTAVPRLVGRVVWPVNRNQISDSGSVACVAWVVVVAAALTVELVAG
ncbi:hypothetical protein H7J83_10150 [Mycobacterium mantenii]|nr:hypothetical protein [Mycobacterium mantenii]MCV7243103.1 hypothetical protein [Mycobacterium mantenii]